MKFLVWTLNFHSLSAKPWFWGNQRTNEKDVKDVRIPKDMGPACMGPAYHFRGSHVLGSPWNHLWIIGGMERWHTSLWRVPTSHERVGETLGFSNRLPGHWVKFWIYVNIIRCLGWKMFLRCVLLFSIKVVCFLEVMFFVFKSFLWNKSIWIVVIRLVLCS